MTQRRQTCKDRTILYKTLLKEGALDTAVRNTHLEVTVLSSNNIAKGTQLRLVIIMTYQVAEGVRPWCC